MTCIAYDGVMSSWVTAVLTLSVILNMVCSVTDCGVLRVLDPCSLPHRTWRSTSPRHPQLTQFVDCVLEVAQTDVAMLSAALNSNYTFMPNETFEFVQTLQAKYGYLTSNGHYSLFDAAYDGMNGIEDATADYLSTMLDAVVIGTVLVVLVLSGSAVLIFQPSLNAVCVCVCAN